MSSVFFMSTTIKLELGSGNNPQPGFVHLDVSKSMPHVEIECDVSTQRIPIPDGCVSELLANHLIEHIPWRKLPHVFGEIKRVTIPGARIFMRTPDLEFIAKTYLAGKMTDEHPNDVNTMKSVFGECGPSQWAIIKLHSGQDYPSNFHFLAMDKESMTQILKKNGFERITFFTGENRLQEFSPGELQVEAFRS